jgi:hypothetical protein
MSETNYEGDWVRFRQPGNPPATGKVLEHRDDGYLSISLSGDEKEDERVDVEYVERKVVA